MPESICPDIGPFKFYLDAFQELATCRPSGFGIGPIPFTSIVEYSKIYQVEDFDDFLYYIRLLDNKVLEIEKRKSNDGNGKSGKTN